MHRYRFKLKKKIFLFLIIFIIFILIIVLQDTIYDLILECSNNTNLGENNTNPGGNNINPGGSSGYFKVVLHARTDTDRLADFLQDRKNAGCFNIRQAGIKLSPPRYTNLSSFSELESRIARYVHINHNNIFYRGSPQNTIINNRLLSKIRDLHENVPVDFV